MMDHSYPYIASLTREPFLFYEMRSTAKLMAEGNKADQSLDCNLIVCNLYKTFLSICDDMDITDAIPDMEKADGGR